MAAKLIDISISSFRTLSFVLIVFRINIVMHCAHKNACCMSSWWHPCFGRWFFILCRRCSKQKKWNENQLCVHKLCCWALDQAQFFFSLKLSNCQLKTITYTEHRYRLTKSMEKQAKICFPMEWLVQSSTVWKFRTKQEQNKIIIGNSVRIRSDEYIILPYEYFLRTRK